MADIPNKSSNWFRYDNERGTQTERFDDSKLDQFDLSVANIKDAEEVFVIKKTVRELEKGKLSVNQVEALFSRAISIRRTYNSPYADNTPYPQDESRYDNNLNSLKFFKSDHINPISKHNSIFPDGLQETDIDDGVLIGVEKVAIKAFEMATPSEQLEISKHILKIYPYIDDLDHGTVARGLIKMFEKSDSYEEIFSLFAEKIWEQRNEYNYRITEKTSVSGGWIDDMAEDVALYTDGKQAIKYLSKLNDNIKIKKMLGIFVDSASFPKIINATRDYLLESKDPRVERIGRMLIGEDPDDTSIVFHTRLENIYERVDFSKYPANLAAVEQEVDLIMHLIKNGDVILDKGCGTGRFSNELAKRCKEKSISVKIIAFDYSTENINKAKESDSTKTVLYFQGDWNSIPLEEESVDLIIDLGRNNTHVENWDKLVKALVEPTRLLKPTGKILADWPDPNKGEYLENRKRYMKILQGLNIPIDPENPKDLENFSYVIDGPDKKDEIEGAAKYGNVYNRYTPQFKEIKSAYGQVRLDPKEIDKKPIAGWKESDNIYYLFTVS